MPYRKYYLGWMSLLIRYEEMIGRQNKHFKERFTEGKRLTESKATIGQRRNL